MALRILSGMVFIPRGGIQTGSVEIAFNPFELTDASDASFELRKKRAIGPTGRFVASPASIVAARQFDLLASLSPSTRVAINDTVTRDSITIEWRAPEGPIFEEEIPFLVVGEVPDPPRRPRRAERSSRSRPTRRKRPRAQPARKK